MRPDRPSAAVGLVALALTTAACSSTSTPSTAPASSSAATAPAATAPAATAPAASGPAATAAPAAPAVGSGAGSVTFDGAYTGSFTSVTCIGSGPTTTAHFSVTYTGNPGTSFTGDMGNTEFGFRAPDGSDFDSLFLTKTLNADGKGFVLDGIVVKDQQSGKSVTMHGTLHCP
jgi:hypothetical protein